ncbi:hypothetical protein EEL49_12070 [Muribaculaceae bacterium Isolate-104 (HZI)]|jgi:hypothetical protein|nr:hypothetical protein EEL49_12070 [Muribaculaceae bacterium Isolate-104 (HZI)]
MAREKTLFRRVLAHESVDYSNYTIAQLQETIEKLVEKVEQRKPRKVVVQAPTNLTKIKRALNKLNLEVEKL